MTAIGTTPFEFTDPDGLQVSIPLAALKFDSSGTLVVDSTKWPPYATYSEAVKNLITVLLKELSEQHILTKPVAVPPKPAMVFTAANPGAAGNNITVDIDVTPALDPDLVEISVTVQEEEEYAELTIATIEGVVGNETTAGSHPGFAHVVSASLDATLLPTEQTVSFPAVAAGASTVDIKDSDDAVVFTLEAEKAGNDARFASAKISHVDPGTETFTLTLTWERSVDTSFSALQTDLAALGYEVKVTPPATGSFLVPGSTSNPVSLTGGAASKAASATIFTG